MRSRNRRHGSAPPGYPYLPALPHRSLSLPGEVCRGPHPAAPIHDKRCRAARRRAPGSRNPSPRRTMPRSLLCARPGPLLKPIPSSRTIFLQDRDPGWRPDPAVARRCRYRPPTGVLPSHSRPGVRAVEYPTFAASLHPSRPGLERVAPRREQAEIRVGFGVVARLPGESRAEAKLATFRQGPAPLGGEVDLSAAGFQVGRQGSAQHLPLLGAADGNREPGAGRPRHGAVAPPKPPRCPLRPASSRPGRRRHWWSSATARPTFHRAPSRCRCRFPRRRRAANCLSARSPPRRRRRRSPPAGRTNRSPCCQAWTRARPPGHS